MKSIIDGVNLVAVLWGLSCLEKTNIHSMQLQQLLHVSEPRTNSDCRESQFQLYQISS